MAWVLGATGLGPNPSPSSFFGRRLRVRTPPAVSLLGACSPQARRLGGTGRGDRGLEPTLDHACWGAREQGIFSGDAVREEQVGIRWELEQGLNMFPLASFLAVVAGTGPPVSSFSSGVSG